MLVKQKDLVFDPTAMGSLAYVVDPRIGFHSKALGVVMAEIPPGRRSGAHRHLWEEIDLIVGGRGKVIVEDKEFDFGTLDVLSISVFRWHQYFNTAPTVAHTGDQHPDSHGQPGSVADTSGRARRLCLNGRGLAR